MKSLFTHDSKFQIIHQKVLLLLAITAIIASAFHFWPFASSPLWKVVNIANISMILGSLLIVIGIVFQKKDKVNIRHMLPPLSIWAYLLFHVLSCAYADTFSRPAVYTLKVSLVMIGGYLLFTRAFQAPKAAYVP